MRKLLFIFALLLSCTITYAQKQELYSRARIYLDQQGHSINDLAALGVAVDHGEHKKGTYFTSDFSASELSRVRNAGFKVEVVINDVSKHYREQNKKKAEKTTAVSCDNPPYDVPSHFHLGSYGGFFTYDEMIEILDSMQLLYPGLISVKQPIGTHTTIEGRPIYWLRISNNPSVDQPLKPQAMYTALHHAREPGSLSALIYYMWYLLEHYSTDNRIKQIIDNSELYFVPCLNPDGYIYNNTVSAGGGGMWRKNRRDNMDGTFGVDLNRNYSFQWGYDDVGSSPITSGETYRGTAGFSEPETQAIKWFTDNHDFKFVMNYHSYHNNLLYSWSYIPSFQTVDSSRFFRYGAFLTEYNDYRFGTCDQVLNYITNGDANDWMYGETTDHSKIMAFTPEVGATDNGFYPPETQIIPDCQNNLYANINVASLLLPFATVRHTDEKILTRETGYLHFHLQRLGLPDVATFTASIVPLDSWLSSSAAPKVYSGLTMLQEINDSLSYTLLPSTPNGQLVRYILRLNNGLFNVDDTVGFYYGKKYARTSPSTNSLGDWVNSGWGLSTGVYHSAPAAIQSSLSGAANYPDNSNLTITTATPVDLTYATRAYLHFYTKWATETDYDYVFVNARPAGSGSWSELCGRHTRPKRLTGEPSFDGQMPNWTMEEMDLSDYLGQKIDIQFQLRSDNFGNYRGFYFDDFTVITVQDTPTAVTSVSNKPQVSVFPNPAASQLNISIQGHDFGNPLTAYLYDCTGRVVSTMSVTGANTSATVAHLPAGVYTLRINGTGESWPVVKVAIVR